LQEYCPDILRILKCGVEPCVHNAQAIGERVIVDGAARVSVLYAAEDGTLQCFEQTYPFSRTADIAGLTDDCVLSATVKTEFANARAVSQRRLDIHAMLGVRLCVVRRRRDEVLTDAVGSGVQTRSKICKLSSLEALGETGFSLSEVIEVDQNAPPVDQIICRRAVAIPGEIKAIKNKLMLKGTLEVRVIYRSRDAKEPVQIVHTMPISQIIEVQGVGDTTQNTLQMALQSLEVTQKANASGALRLLDINARIAAGVKGYQSLEIPVLVDAYSTQGGVGLDTQNFETQLLHETFRDTFIAKHSVNFSDGVTDVLLCTAELLPHISNCKGNALDLNGQARFHVIYLDGEGQLRSAEKDIPLVYHRALNRAGNAPRIETNLQLLNAQHETANDGLELRAEIGVDGNAFAREDHTIVRGISPLEEEIVSPRSPLTIYFAAEQEPLWEIARRYRTTIDAIRTENDISADTATGGQMLLIPTL
jgi:hypothetical protein